MTHAAVIDWCYDPDLLRPLVGADTDYQSALAAWLCRLLLDGGRGEA